MLEIKRPSLSMAKDKKSNTLHSSSPIIPSHMPQLGTKNGVQLPSFVFFVLISLWLRALQTLLGGNSLPSIVRVYCCFIRHPRLSNGTYTNKEQGLQQRSRWNVSNIQKGRKKTLLFIAVLEICSRTNTQTNKAEFSYNWEEKLIGYISRKEKYIF